MKTSTIVWTLAVLIIFVGVGSYLYSGTIPTSTTSVEAPTNVNEIPNPSGTNLPVGDMAPTLPMPIASSSTSTNASANSNFR